MAVQTKQNVFAQFHNERATTLNKFYFLDVFKSGNDGKWHGSIWKKQDCTQCHQDECKCVRLVYAFQDGFNKPHQAACDLNARIDGIQLSVAEEKASGLSSADLPLLKKLEIRPSERENIQAFQMKKSFERTLY